MIEGANPFAKGTTPTIRFITRAVFASPAVSRDAADVFHVWRNLLKPAWATDSPRLH